MRFVPIKTAEQQAAQLLHRGREQLVGERTMLVNALRAHLAEFGMVAAQGLRNVAQLISAKRRLCNTVGGRVIEGCLYRKLDPAIMVMKSAEDGRRYNVAHVLNGAMDRSVLVERPMSPQLIIVGSILRQNPA